MNLMWLLSKVACITAILFSARSTLKILKILSLGRGFSVKDKKSQLDKACNILMFWTVYGFLMVWEYAIEYFFRWIPGYYYFKSIFVIAIAIHQTKVANFVFFDILVPLMERCYENLKGNNEPLPGALDMIATIPIIALFILFPMLHEKTNGESKFRAQVTMQQATDNEKCVPENKSLENIMKAQSCGTEHLKILDQFLRQDIQISREDKFLTKADIEPEPSTSEEHISPYPEPVDTSDDRLHLHTDTDTDPSQDRVFPISIDSSGPGPSFDASFKAIISPGSPSPASASRQQYSMSTPSYALASEERLHKVSVACSHSLIL